MRYLLCAMLLTAGCGKTWETVDAETPEETFVLAETIRVSGVLGQRVVGEISTTFYEVKCADGSPCHATGWYVWSYGSGSKGIAYYYKPDLPRYSTEILTGLAEHEVCHSLTGPAHYSQHALCEATSRSFR